MRTSGEALITLGMVVLLFVFYEVYVTDWISAGKQRTAAASLDDAWRNQRATHYDVVDGKGFAKIFIPAFGPDWAFAVLEGTSDATLESGPGHYKGSALPGEPGNFSIAGHRVGKGSPFNDLDKLNSCDAIVVETAQSWFIYRVLPMATEVKGWDSGRGKQDQQCLANKVKPLGAPYTGLVGQEIVSPTQADVVAVVPHHSDLTPSASQEAHLITLTTCHPRFSARQRLIVHGVLVMQYPKDPAHPDNLPPEFKES